MDRSRSYRGMVNFVRSVAPWKYTGEHVTLAVVQVGRGHQLAQIDAPDERLGDIIRNSPCIASGARTGTP